MTAGTTTRVTTEPRRSARRRLLDAAGELFYAEGVQTVGIDRVIEQAGVAKASLYNCFGSKEELVAAYLDERRERSAARVTAAIAAADTPRAKVLAVFEAQRLAAESGTYRGCAFIAASTEAPRGGLVDQATTTYRAWVCELFIGLARDAGARDPETLGQQLQVLYDGAAVGVRVEADSRAMERATQIAAVLLDSAT